jgi:hypothetical protein
MADFDAESRARQLLTAHLHYLVNDQREQDLLTVATIQRELVLALYDNPERISALLTELAGTAVSAFVNIASAESRDPLAVWQRICEGMSDEPD